MPEIVENGRARWDAGAGTTALGIIGTTLGGLLRPWSVGMRSPALVLRLLSKIRAYAIMTWT